jgi:hypothetical protein
MKLDDSIIFATVLLKSERLLVQVEVLSDDYQIDTIID